jgi:hypothetical protein
MKSDFHDDEPDGNDIERKEIMRIHESISITGPDKPPVCRVIIAVTLFRPSLWDLDAFASGPGVETPRYFHLSRRDNPGNSGRSFV